MNATNNTPRSPLVRRFAIWGLLVLLLAAGLAYALMPRPVPVDLITATRGPMVATLDDEGETRIRDTFVLSAPVAGRLRRIEAEVGDRVLAGETIVASIEPLDPAFLDPRDEAEAEAALRAAEAAKSMAEAELAEANAELEFASAEVERARRLIEKGVIPARTLDERERAFKFTRAAVETAKALLRMRDFEQQRARARLVSPTQTQSRHGQCDCVPIPAPVTGQVLRVLRESEGVVQGGEALVEIGDPADLEVVVDYLSSDAVKVEPGQRVLIEEWGGPIPLNGRVRRIEPFGFTKVSALGIEEQRVNVVIDFSDPPDLWARLGHGYQVDTAIVLWEASSALQLPLTAVFREGGDWSVFVAQDGRASLRPVEIGRRNGLVAEIVGGLEGGERVVQHPSDRIGDGVAIEERGD